MASRPLVQVFSGEDGKVIRSVTLPGVFTTPIRPDVVQLVHMNINKNKRQAYSVAEAAGHQTSAVSWGTGRAVARIPRVSGGGTHRSGQGAFGNMCRSGRMFAPTKIWRRWHRKVSVNQKRYALTSALAASAVPALVMARGHRVSKVGEIPLVVADTFEAVTKTAKAVEVLNRLGAEEDLEHSAVRHHRAGLGKLRGRRTVSRRGPLVVYSQDNGISLAVRNIPGVEACSVERLNLLQLAPGGHLGRFIVWTQSAFNRLNALYGSQTSASTVKRGYHIPRPLMANPDLNRIINSDEVQSVVKPVQRQQKYGTIKKNPLTNLGVRIKLNPHTKAVIRKELKSAASTDKRAAARKKARKAAVVKARAKQSRKFYKSMVATA